MKKWRFSLAVILPLLLFFAMLPSASVNAAEDNEGTHYYYNQLNQRQQYFYNWLKDYYDAMPAKPAVYKIDFVHLLSAKPTAQEYDTLWRDIIYAEMALTTDQPLYLLKGRVASCGYANVPEDRYFYIDIEKMDILTADVQARVDARIRQIVATIGNGDRYTKLRKLTDHLIRTTSYDPYLDRLNTEGHHSYALASRGHFYNQSVYGLLLEGIAVCDGYTQSVKLLCNELNIPCIIMGNEGHAWNLVQMEDGKWYRLDMTQICRNTWDEEPSETIIKSYFQDIFLNNSAVDHQNPYMLSLDGVALVTTFPEHATQPYQYTGSTTDFSYTVAAYTYTPGAPKFSYRINSDGKTCTITNYEGKESGDLTIPGKLDGYTVTAIDPYAFYYCTGFTGKLTIPNTVETIGKGCFAGCYNLTSVKLPDNLHKLGQSAFIGCKKLTEITLPDLVDEVSDFAFLDCNNLATITFGTHIQTFGIEVFLQTADNAVVKGPANSVAQTRATEEGLTFQATGTLCTFRSVDGRWMYTDKYHYQICQHGARVGYAEHVGTYCGWECATCGAQYCGNKNVYTDTVLTLINAKPATCNSVEYTGDLQCICGKITEYGDWVGEFTNTHAPAEDTWQFDAFTHWQLCVCDTHLNSGSHTGGTATTTQQAKCAVCGASYGSLKTDEPEPSVPPTDPPAPDPTVPPTDPPAPDPTVPPTDPPAPDPTVPPTDPPAPDPTVPPTDPPAPDPTVPPTDPSQPDPTVPPTDPPKPDPTVPPTDPTQPDPTVAPTQPSQPELDTDANDPVTPDSGFPGEMMLWIGLAVAIVAAGGALVFWMLQKKKKAKDSL